MVCTSLDKHFSLFYFTFIYFFLQLTSMGDKKPFHFWWDLIFSPYCKHKSLAIYWFKGFLDAQLFQSLLGFSVDQLIYHQVYIILVRHPAWSISSLVLQSFQRCSHCWCNQIHLSASSFSFHLSDFSGERSFCIMHSENGNFSYLCPKWKYYIHWLNARFCIIIIGKSLTVM